MRQRQNRLPTSDIGVNINTPLTRTSFNLSLRRAPAHPELVEGRGNLDEAEHTSTNRRSNGDGIATLAMTKWVRMSNTPTTRSILLSVDYPVARLPMALTRTRVALLGT